MSELLEVARRALGRRGMLFGGLVGGAALAMTARTAAADGNEHGRVQDEAAIKQLSVDYARGTDAIGRNDKAAGIALYRRAFTDTTEIMVAGAPSTLRVGPLAWADFVDSVFRGSNYDRTQHLIGTIDVQLLGGNRATMSTYLHATHRVTGNTSLRIVLGTYDDEVARVRGQWRITRRTLSVMTAWGETPS